METIGKLKKEGWEEFKDNHFLALEQLRKGVYCFSKSMGTEAMDELILNSGLDYLNSEELAGNTIKEKLISLLALCQEHHRLVNLLEAIDKIIPDVLDQNVIRNINDYLKVDIQDLAFNIPSSTCCVWRKIEDGKTDYKYLHRPTFHYTNHPCERVEICVVCGEETHRTKEHDWGEWKYISDKNCTQIRCCKKCGEKEKAYNMHHWKRIERANGSYYKICSHCHQEEFKVRGEWRGFVNWGNGQKDLWILTIKEKNWDIFGLFSLKAVVETYVNTIQTPTGLQCDYKVIQEGKWEQQDNQCFINCTKIKEKGTNKKYYLDHFEGQIFGECSYIEGTVSDINMKGTLRLEAAE